MGASWRDGEGGGHVGEFGTWLRTARPGAAVPRLTLSVTGLAQLAGGVVRRFARAQFVYLAGEPAHTVYLVQRGLVKTTLGSGRGEELILRICKPGDLFGELCFCATERGEQARAMEASELVELSARALLSQLEQHPSAVGELLAGICRNLGSSYAQTRRLAFDGTMARLVRVLLALAGEHGTSGRHGVVLMHYIKQEELAQMIAARREVVSGLLNRLRERGLVDYRRRGSITIRKTLVGYLDSLRAGPLPRLSKRAN